jgi:hypothetical protein
LDGPVNKATIAFCFSTAPAILSRQLASPIRH